MLGPVNAGKFTLAAQTALSEKKMKKKKKAPGKSWGKTAMLRMAGAAVTLALTGSAE